MHSAVRNVLDKRIAYVDSEKKSVEEFNKKITKSVRGKMGLN